MRELIFGKHEAELFLSTDPIQVMFPHQLPVLSLITAMPNTTETWHHLQLLDWTRGWNHSMVGGDGVGFGCGWVGDGMAAESTWGLTFRRALWCDEGSGGRDAGRSINRRKLCSYHGRGWWDGWSRCSDGGGTSSATCRWNIYYWLSD